MTALFMSFLLYLILILGIIYVKSYISYDYFDF